MDYYKDDYRGTKLICLILFVFWLIGLIFPGTVTLLAMTPGLLSTTIPHVWTLLSGPYFETSFIAGLTNILAFITMGRTCERVWGVSSFLMFVGLGNLVTMLFVFFTAVFYYFLTQNDKYLFSPVCGFSGLNSALTVAVFQRSADKSLPTFLGNKTRHFRFLKIKHLPACVMVITILLNLIDVIDKKYVSLNFYGILFGWVYLRFYFKDRDTGMVGDMREDFSFATLFPKKFRLQRIIGILGGPIYKFLVWLGFFKAALKTHQRKSWSKFSDRQDSQEKVNKQLTNFSSFGSQSKATIDRRRQLAIQAIDEKLAKLSSQAEDDISPTDGVDIDFSDLDLGSLNPIDIPDIDDIPLFDNPLINDLGDHGPESYASQLNGI